MDENVRQAIIEELSLSKMSKEEVDGVITSVGGSIMQTVFRKIADGLSDELLDEFDNLLSLPNGVEKEEKITAFFEAHVKNMEDVVSASSKEAVEEYKKSKAY